MLSAKWAMLSFSSTCGRAVSRNACSGLNPPIQAGIQTKPPTMESAASP